MVRGAWRPARGFTNRIKVMQSIEYLGLPECVRISNGDAELVVSTAVGPRVLRYALQGGENAFGEYPEKSTKTALGEWKPYAGHRLWASPELFPATYAPDNSPIECEMEGEHGVRLRQPKDASGLRKQMTVSLGENASAVNVAHAITNENVWPVSIAPWSVTALHGGVAVLPRQPYRSHDESVSPSQPLTLYAFTELQDPRYTLGREGILLRAEGGRASAQKVGLRNKRGWCAHLCPASLFIQQFSYSETAAYPDYGANNEAYAAGEYMEIELLGARQTLSPGETAVFCEVWHLHPGATVDYADEGAVFGVLRRHLPEGA
jgi:hypothetical protein